MGEKNERIVVYAPVGFAPTWRKFVELMRRDGKSASAEIRIWIEQYVKGHYPGNPQKPLTAFAPGTPEHKQLTLAGLETVATQWAQSHQGEITQRKVLALVSEVLPKADRPKAVHDLVLTLTKKGFKVFKPA